MSVYNKHLLFNMHGMNIQVTMRYFTRSGEVTFLLTGNNSCLKYYQTPVML
jgi:hypothetical protein